LSSQFPSSVVSSSDYTSASPTKPKVTQKPAKTPRPSALGPPVIAQALDPVDVEVGTLLWLRIPENTFIDRKDGSTRNLTLLFLTEDDSNMLRTSWIQFEPVNQTLYGMPLAEHIGSHTYFLAARDSDGLITKNKFKVLVISSTAGPSAPLSHEFSVVFDMPFEMLKDDVNNRLSVTDKIAKAFGDNDSSKVFSL